MTRPLPAGTFLFFALLQAYLQREFEVVLTLALAVAVLLLRPSPRRHRLAVRHRLL